ncbi:helix-turn-helix transcriptional regulator [Salaquimonas pukyongi]|uniref:helix-turn-helix transcriptional regulator n=1 Tax=Salaquimonas pukyongi TaxID=2712698 RepID=UPI00096BC576|nr:helix-turn-helix transcriptional regulator [Salaquimonas pukyongi]
MNVTISKEEYDRLLEAAQTLADLQAYDRTMAALDSGEEELIPAETANRILNGESPLAVFREWRGYNQSSLAKASGVNRVQIADIEAGRSSGSVATLKKLADALQVSIDDLVA